MHPNAERIVAAGRELGLDVEVHTFPEGTRTAVEAAEAVGTDVARIVKSLVFLEEGDPARPVLALVGGADRLDVAKLARACDVTRVGRADADGVRAATGFPIGGVPPFGHAETLPTYVDRHLLDHDVVWAAAGTPRDVFPVAPGDLVDPVGAVPTDLV